MKIVTLAIKHFFGPCLGIERKHNKFMWIILMKNLLDLSFFYFLVQILTLTESKCPYQNFPDFNYPLRKRHYEIFATKKIKFQKQVLLKTLTSFQKVIPRNYLSPPYFLRCTKLSSIDST